MKEDCIFCKLAKGNMPRKVIYESDNFIVFPDINQKVKGHCLIVPKEHFVNILDLPIFLGNELLGVIKEVAGIQLKDGAEGFNILQNNCECAGQAVMHVHFHFFPRRKGDGFSIVA